MLYTSTPLERIFTDRNKKNEKGALDKEKEGNEVKTIHLSHGQIYVKKNGDNYVVDGIQSTDMSDYLKKEYAIGEEYNIR